MLIFQYIRFRALGKGGIGKSGHGLLPAPLPFWYTPESPSPGLLCEACIHLVDSYNIARPVPFQVIHHRALREFRVHVIFFGPILIRYDAGML